MPPTLLDILTATPAPADQWQAVQAALLTVAEQEVTEAKQRLEVALELLRTVSATIAPAAERPDAADGAA